MSHADFRKLVHPWIGQSERQVSLSILAARASFAGELRVQLLMLMRKPIIPEREDVSKVFFLGHAENATKPVPRIEEKRDSYPPVLVVILESLDD